MWVRETWLDGYLFGFYATNRACVYVLTRYGPTQKLQRVVLGDNPTTQQFLRARALVFGK